jgi:hypothetical protein
MTASPDRIRTQRHVTAMAALDTVDLLAERVTQLLSHGRRMTIARRYTYMDCAPEVTAGLTLSSPPRRWASDRGRGFQAALSGTGFGFSAYPGEADTEAEVWARYHAGEAASEDLFKRRRDMTYVEIVGGMAGDGPARDDLIVIRAWNGDGVADERVVAFDTGLLWEQQDAAEAAGR